MISIAGKLMSARLYLVGILSGILVSMATSESYAWTAKGHEIVAEIAQANVTSSAQSAIAELLSLEDSPDLKGVAIWADEVKTLKIPLQPRHTIKLPLDKDTVDPKTDCNPRRCLVTSIQYYERVLVSNKQPLEAKLIALKYIVHLVADIHQPLHTSTDQGKRIVSLHGKQLRLHRVWDDNVVTANSTLVDRLPTQPDLCINVPQKTPLEWAVEGRDIARDEIFSELTGADVVLDGEYTSRHWPTVSKRLTYAGCRLAGLLNEAFKK